MAQGRFLHGWDGRERVLGASVISMKLHLVWVVKAVCKKILYLLLLVKRSALLAPPVLPSV